MQKLKLSDADFVKRREKLVRESVQKAFGNAKKKKIKKAPSKRKHKAIDNHK